ncbi:MAG: aminodeoxychorismate/anthranilate synthase component II [Chitinispirillaceae bacterium]|nr:aminodeoxychorismate/anthranilate synthase component II [Chitinispirillaceae bacterium]
MKPSLLVIDNYDSFTYNLVQMFRHYPLEISVFRADKITVEEVEQRSPDYIVVSPGPKDPSAAGISIALILHLYKTIPIFGVCLGMQCINEAFGGRTVRAPLPMHGKTSLVEHCGKWVFQSVNQPTTVARYHSLAVEQIHTDLEITAKTSEGVVMGLSHKQFPLHGVQFHPESFLTEEGFTMIENFLRLGPLQEHIS